MLPLLIPLISLASSLVPDLIGLFGGKRAGAVASEVSNVVQQVVGTSDPVAAARAVADDKSKAAELRIRLEQIRQRYAELQVQDAKDERAALIETLKAEITDRSRASATMLGALDIEGWTAKAVALGPVVVSIGVLVGFFGFTGWMVNRPPNSSDPTALTLLNVVVGALVAGFTAVINFWLGSSQGSRDKDKAVAALQIAQTTQATENVRQVREATTEATAAARAPPVPPEASVRLPEPPAQPGQPSHFDLCLPVILEREGGFSDHPLDSGGPTMFGITQATLADWRGHPVTADDVRNLTRQEAAQIYRARYWNQMGCDDLPKGIDLMMFDFGVNSGPRRAVLTLQGIVGTEPDGVIGPFTLTAVKAVPDVRGLIDTLARLRLEFVHGLSNAATFGNGWTKRIDDVRRRSLLMAA